MQPEFLGLADWCAGKSEHRFLHRVVGATIYDAIQGASETETDKQIGVWGGYLESRGPSAHDVRARLEGELGGLPATSTPTIRGPLAVAVDATDNDAWVSLVGEGIPSEATEDLHFDYVDESDGIVYVAALPVAASKGPGVELFRLVLTPTYNYAG